MIEILRKMFKTNPQKSKILLKEKCSDCGCEIIIEIRPTPAGFGLLGGALYKCTPDGYSAKCHDCCQVNPKSP